MIFSVDLRRPVPCPHISSRSMLKIRVTKKKIILELSYLSLHQSVLSAAEALGTSVCMSCRMQWARWQCRHRRLRCKWEAIPGLCCKAAKPTVGKGWGTHAPLSRQEFGSVPCPPLCRELKGNTFASRHRGTARVWGLQSAPLGTCSPCPWSSFALGSVGPRG